MGSLGTTHLISLMLAVATAAALGGFIASTVARRHKKRARVYFLAGFCCGLLTGGILRRRRRGLIALRSIASWADVPTLRALIRDRGSSIANAWR